MGRLPAWAKFSAVAAAVLLSPLLAFSTAIAIEILIGAVKDAGAMPLLVIIVAAAGAGSLLRKRGRPGRRAPVAT
jgi:hypothetical protein